MFPFCSSILQQRTVPSNSSMGNKPLVTCNRSDREGQTWWHLPAVPCRDVANVNRRAPTIPHLLSSAQTANMSRRPWSSDHVSLLASMSLSLTPSSLQRSFLDLLCYGRLTRDDQEPKPRPAAALSVRKTVRIVPQVLGSLSIHPWGA